MTYGTIDNGRRAYISNPVRRQEPIGSGDGTMDMFHQNSRAAHLFDDLSAKEQGQYSILRALHAAAKNDWSEAGLEREVSKTLAKRLGREAMGFFVPADLPLTSRAAYNVGTGSQGGNLVATNLMADQFVEVLRNRLAVVEAGATLLTGLQGNIDIPRRTAATNTYWVSEGAAITDDRSSFDVISLRPKTVGALSSWTRLMALQSTPDIEMLIRKDFVYQLTAAIDLAAIKGTGASNQPTGILNTAGIGSVAMGTNGAAITFDAMADLRRKVAVANADVESASYLTTAAVEGRLIKERSTGSGEYILEPAMAPIAGTPPTIWGRRLFVSNQVPSNLTKGTGSSLSAVVFGDFSQLIVGMWGAMDILLNPYGSGYAAGNFEIRAMQTVDIGVRHPEAFAAITDAITA